MLEISEIIAQAQQKGASDIHIVTGLPVKCRIDGKVQNLTEKVLTWEDCEYYAKCLAGDLFHEIECIGELDLARTFPCGARTRINLFRQQGGGFGGDPYFGGYHPGDRGVEFAAGRFRIPGVPQRHHFSHG